MSYLRFFSVALCGFLALGSPGRADELAWSIWADDRYATLSYGIPDSGFLIFRIECELSSGLGSLLVINPQGVQDGDIARISVRGPDDQAEYAGVVGFDEGEDAFTVMAPLISARAAVTPLRGTGTLTVAAPGVEHEIPLELDSTSKIDEFEMLCPPGN